MQYGRESGLTLDYVTLMGTKVVEDEVVCNGDLTGASGGAGFKFSTEWSLEKVQYMAKLLTPKI